MAERSIIHVGGGPGSGKSRMSRALVDRLHESTDLRAEHISVGDHVRMLARGAIASDFREYVVDHLDNPDTAIQPLPENIISEILHVSLESASSRDVDIVFLDGYPKYSYQVDLYFDWAQRFGYSTPGALITETNPDNAMSRVLKRGRDQRDRYMDAEHALDKLALHKETYEVVLTKLGSCSIRFSTYPVDTSGTKEQTDGRAFEATMRLLGEPLPKSA